MEARRKWVAVTFAAMIALVACSSPAAAPSGFAPAPKLIATDATFADFRTWERVPLEDAMVPVNAIPGASFVYANRRADPGARRWPIGTVLVKTVEPSDDFRDWTVHAMVKRSARFNPEGSVGWEFFGIQLDEHGAPTILWRSDGHDAHRAYGSSSAAPITDRTMSCNDCHALHWQTDAVLTPALSLMP